MKTLMVVGAPAGVHSFARAARRMSYWIIVGADRCAMPARPGIRHVFLESGDREEVLRMARDYGVTGILGLGEAAALSAAYAAQLLGLPGIRYAEERLFHDLLQMRTFQEQNDFRVPRYQDLTHSMDTGTLQYPLYVSPTDGQTLRHTIRITGPEQLPAARKAALRHSPGGRVIAQEELVGGEGQEDPVLVMTELIVRDGMLEPILWCEALLDHDTTHHAPIGARYPARIGRNARMLLAGECTRMVTLLHLRDAHIPVLAWCVPGGIPCLLRVGVRDSACMMLRFLSNLYRHDLLRDALRIAAGDRVSARRYHEPSPGTCRAYYTIPIPRTGFLRHLHFNRALHRYCKGFLHRPRQSQFLWKENIDGNNLGTLMMEFPNEQVMDDILEHIDSLIIIEVDELRGRQ